MKGGEIHFGCGRSLFHRIFPVMREKGGKMRIGKNECHAIPK